MEHATRSRSHSAVPLQRLLGEEEATDVAAAQRVELERALPWYTFLGEVTWDAAPRSWADRAACRGRTATMFPNDASTLAARQLCERCPVFSDCAEWAELVGTDSHGVIAGMSATTRRNRRQASQPTRAWDSA